MLVSWLKQEGPWDMIFLGNAECSGARVHVLKMFSYHEQSVIAGWWWTGLTLGCCKRGIWPAENIPYWSESNLWNLMLLSHFQHILNYLFNPPCGNFPDEISKATVFCQIFNFFNYYSFTSALILLNSWGNWKQTNKNLKRMRQRKKLEKKKDKQTHQNDNC